MANPLLTAALAYAERGWPVFPCTVEKTPLTKGSMADATTDPAVIKGWWEKWPRANIGFEPGSCNMMVLDLDPGSDIKELDRLVGGLPETLLRARTPRGGQHLFYAIGEDETVPLHTAMDGGRNNKFGEHVDVRSFHSYVCLSPSVTKDGTYVWEGDGKPHYRTDEMYRIAHVATEKSKDRDNWIVEPDLPENVTAAIEWLKTSAKPAVKGHGGNKCAYATGAYMKSLAISEPMAFELMWDHWAPRCTPAWYSDESLEKCIEHAYEYNTSPPGNLTPHYKAAKLQGMFRPIDRAPLSAGVQFITPDNRFRFVDRDGIAAIKPPEWLIPDLVPEGAYMILFGTFGTFKSFIAIDIALTIVTGLATNPIWTANKSGPVLYCAGEGRAMIGQRIVAWEAMHWGGEKAEGIVLGDPVPGVGEDWGPFIDGALKLSPQGYRMVMFDTMGQSMAGTNEGAFENASLFGKNIKGACAALGFGGVPAVGLGVHHEGHDAKGRPQGSNAFVRDPDTIIGVSKARPHDLHVKLHMLKQKDAPEWPEDRTLYMAPSGPSLAVKSMTTPKPGSAPPVPAPNTSKSKAHLLIAEATADKVIDRAIKEELEKNSAGALSQQSLAEVLAQREDIDVPSPTLRTRTLVRLRETKGTYANKAYHPRNRPADKWRRWAAE